MVSVMWFRRDLRLEDNVALKQAFQDSDSLLLLFHVNPKQFLSDNSSNQAAFFKSVAGLRDEVKMKKGTLHILYGDIEECFLKLKKEIPDWSNIYINRDETGYGLERDKLVSTIFKELGVTAHGYYDHHIHAAREIKTNSGTYYKVFTPYYNKWIELEKPGVVKVVFDETKLIKEPLFSKDEDQFNHSLDKQIAIKELQLGNQAAHERLDIFIKQDLNDYNEARDYPLKNATSQLSKHLRAGELSIRTVYDEVSRSNYSSGKETFIKELAWRDFYNMIYATHPDQKDQSINLSFRQVEWENNEQLFDNWKEGMTGFPLVDAAMRQLKETGWMHNRLRMVTASFLTKDLLIDWRWGEKYFQEMLVDYDPASNIGGWQWAASTGTDSVPYFRIFNPTTQSEKFDKNGDFIKYYVPELKNIANLKIHDPSKLSEKEQNEFGVMIGKDYPEPIISHKQRRQLTIKVFEESKKVFEESRKIIVNKEVAKREEF
ncbi:deoxyribodipyrimidine photo-lyase type I [Carnobacterium iners]|uniref:Deoxyribodipyrimidine photo-lyase n=1 Tax=Carnobacterium iners TaxID=1073423 RepID=A0A1X7MTQ8_9LACT|nr:deoxyribodipyrimidine photo-lyase [Carnobacterium iners]SEK56441.1 deoxyribodipyrimidine photo-lyase type I [Carnobacterium iners]SMH28193.1 deoxyribodipyrimidine photo-lyase type I [Carnobacterium iners]